MKERLIYKEIQDQKSIPLFITMGSIYTLIISGLLYVVFSTFIFNKNPLEGHINSDGIIVISLIIPIIIGLSAYMILSTKLIVRIYSNSLEIDFFPYKTKTIIIKSVNISDWKVREYKAYREFGGYGIRPHNNHRRRRLRKKNGMAYILKGKQGLQLSLNTGERILIGTQRPKAIKRAMNKLMQ